MKAAQLKENAQHKAINPPELRPADFLQFSKTGSRLNGLWFRAD